MMDGLDYWDSLRLWLAAGWVDGIIKYLYIKYISSCCAVLCCV